ncbi:MAG: hypothetical protein JNJ70_01505 [Verrucomicrobiales bacterium]|nr:hypothetical protein [Verrucomicrobiales bacterium]
MIHTLLPPCRFVISFCLTSVALSFSGCRTTEPGVVEEPKQPENYLAKIVDYGAFSHDGYFLQKNAILKYHFGNSYDDRGTKIEKKRLTSAEVSEVISQLKNLGVSEWLPSYGSARSEPSAQGWSDCGFSSWEFHFQGLDGIPEIKSNGLGMFPADDDPKKTSVMAGTQRYGAVWDVFRKAFESNQ